MTISKTTAAVAVAAGAVALGMSACGSDDDDANSGSASDVKVGYSTAGLDEFLLLEQQQTAEQIDELGMTLVGQASANGDSGKQLSDIQTLVSQGANGIIVVPNDSKAIKPAIDSLNSKDIPVVAVDIAPEGAEVDMVVRTNNIKMGADACEQMGTALKGEGTVLALQGAFTTSNGRDRAQGFDDCMKDKFPGITVIDRQTDWETDKCAQFANTDLASNKAITGVYMAADTICLSPVLSALKSAGRDAPVGEPGHVYLAAINGSPVGLDMIRAGRLDLELSQPLDLYAKHSALYLEQAAAGETFEVGPTDHGSEIIDVGGNLEDSLPATVVTKDNVDDQSLWGNQVK